MELDLAILLDCTGSMGGTINDLRRDLKDIVQHLCSSDKCSVVRTALVRFRDHPPQDNTFVTQVFDFSDNVAVVQAHLDNSQADGGGDGPEAISDAMNDGLHNLSWNGDSKKVIVLCTDARPHGVAHACGEYDSFSRGCPSGHDPVALAHEMARRSITLLSICTETANTRFMAGISLITGGRLVHYTQAINNFGELMVGLILEDFDIEAMMAQVQNEFAAEAERMGTAIDEQELTRRMAGITSGKLRHYEFPNEQIYGTPIAQAEDLEAYLKFKTLDEACDYISQNYKSFRRTHEPAGRRRPITTKRKKRDVKPKKHAVAKPLVVKVSKKPMKPKVLGVRKSLRLALRNASHSSLEAQEDTSPPQLELIREQGEELNQEIRRLVRKAIARKEHSKK